MQLHLKNNIICVLFTLLFLSGCGGGDICLEPDDFGFAKATISSRYDPTLIFGTQENEVGPWIDDGLVLDGNPVYVMVKNWNYKIDDNTSGVVSAWCPWYGDKDHGSTLVKFCERLSPCNFQGAENCYDANGEPTSNECVTNAMCTNTRDAQITNAPCIMTKAVGLYALLTEPGYTPNLSINTITNPQGISIHLGDPHVGYVIPTIESDGSSSNAGGILYDYDARHDINSNRLQYINGKIYFKILDHYYNDNSGQYRVYIKSGVVNGGWDPISWCIDLVKTALFGVNPTGSVAMNYGNGGSGIVPAIYSNVVAQSSFINVVRAVLMLYVIFSAMGFLLGSLELTQKELLHRVFKITIIVALISPYSWQFFNTNLFIWFYEGTGFVVNILTDVAASGPGSTNPLSFFFSREIFIKLSALLFSTPTGWIYITIYIIMLIYLVVIYFDAAVIYMTALIMMGVLISIAPVFIILYLFEQTKSFFDNWLKQLMSYAIQMILVYAGILFMTMIIRNQIYNTLGFPTCALEFPNVLGITIFKWYMPQIDTWGDNPQQALIPVPKDHFQTPQDSTLAFGFAQTNLTDNDFCTTNPNLCNNINVPQSGSFCPAYGCLGMRYPDLPFLDPNDSYESTLINQIRGGYIGDFSGLAIIVICIYLMDHFNKSTVSMAKFLSNTMGNQGDNSKAASAASAGLKAMAMQPVHYADKRLGVSAAAGAARDKVHDFFAQAKYKIIDKPWADYKVDSLKKDALNQSRWTKAMRQDAEKETGTSFKDATEYNSKYKNMKNTAEYSKLSADEKKVMDTKIADAKAKQEAFQDAYVKSYVKMSNEGRGFLQKRSSLLRWGQDVKNKMNANVQKEEQERLLKGEQWVSKFDNMKRLISGGLVGGERSQILYNDSHMRTMDEQLSNTIAEKNHAQLTKDLNRAITKEGRDIQRPDANAYQYHSLITEHLKSSVRQELKFSDKEGKKALLMGDTYMKTKMNDQGLKDTIDQLRAKEQHILESDPYLKATSEYAGNKVALERLEARAKIIHDTVQKEIDHVNEIRVGRGMKEYTATGKDTQYGGDRNIDSRSQSQSQTNTSSGREGEYTRQPGPGSSSSQNFDSRDQSQSQTNTSSGREGGPTRQPGSGRTIDSESQDARGQSQSQSQTNTSSGREGGPTRQPGSGRTIDSESQDARGHSEQSHTDTSDMGSGRQPNAPREETRVEEESFRKTTSSSHNPFSSTGTEQPHATEKLSAGSAGHSTPKPASEPKNLEASESVNSSMDILKGKDITDIQLKDLDFKGIDDTFREGNNESGPSESSADKYKYEEPTTKKGPSSEPEKKTGGSERSGNADTPEAAAPSTTTPNTRNTDKK